MTEIGQKLLSVIPKTIKRDDPILSAIFGNEKGNSALEEMFIKGQEVLEEYSRNDNIYNSNGEVLEKIVKFFTIFKREYDESDSALKRRVRALFVRGNDLTWGTVQNVKKVFQEYFPMAEVFLVENEGDYQKTVADLDTDINYIKNCDLDDIEDNESLNWTLSNGAEYSLNKSFNGKGSFTGIGDVSQEITLDRQGIYYLNFFHSGSVIVKIWKDNELIDLWTVGQDSNKNGSKTVNFNSVSNDWESGTVFFLAEANDEIRIEFSIVSGYLDHITLFKNMAYPKFCIYCRFEGETAECRTFSLARGEEDPIVIEPIPDYTKEKYYDNSFIVGPVGNSYAMEQYKQVLNLIKPCGVRAFIKIVSSEKKNIE